MCDRRIDSHSMIAAPNFFGTQFWGENGIFKVDAFIGRPSNIFNQIISFEIIFPTRFRQPHEKFRMNKISFNDAS